MRILQFFAAVLVVLGLAIGSTALYDSFTEQSADERYADLVDLLSEGALADGMQNGAYDNSPLSLEFASTDGVLQEASKNVRVVNVNMTWILTPEAFKSRLGEFDLQEVPANVQQSFDDSGFFPLELVNSNWLATFVSNSVVFSSAPFTNADFPTNISSDVKLEITLLPDVSFEDNWKREVIYSGTALEFSKKQLISPAFNLVFIVRPQQKVLASPSDNPYTLSNIDEVQFFNTIVYIRNSDFAFYAGLGSVAHPSFNKDIMVIQGVFAPFDLGTPVFVVRDGALEWLGVLIEGESGTGIVLTSDAVINIVMGGEQP